jgi:GxxExxY protein
MFEKIIYPELSYRINGLCFQTHNEIGRFAKEKQYADLLECLLIKNNIKYERETEIPFTTNQNEIFGNIVDFIIEDKIIIECKAKKFVTKKDYHQVQRYLRASGMKLALIVNFRTIYLKPKRVINYS